MDTKYEWIKIGQWEYEHIATGRQIAFDLESDTLGKVTFRRVGNDDVEIMELRSSVDRFRDQVQNSCLNPDQFRDL